MVTKKAEQDTQTCSWEGSGSAARGSEEPRAHVLLRPRASRSPCSWRRAGQPQPRRFLRVFRSQSQSIFQAVSHWRKILQVFKQNVCGYYS